jgi:hypothetical protein
MRHEIDAERGAETDPWSTILGPQATTRTSYDNAGMRFASVWRQAP